MPKLSKERSSSSVEAYGCFPLEEHYLQSLPALPSSPRARSENDDLHYRTSVESISTLCSVKDHEGNRLLEELDNPANIALHSPWIKRLKSFYALQPIRFILDGVWTVVLVLIPSFLRPRTKRKLYSTSYLDGLRGIAGFFVAQVGNPKHIHPLFGQHANDLLGPSTSRCENDLSPDSSLPTHCGSRLSSHGPPRALDVTRFHILKSSRSHRNRRLIISS